MGFRVIKRGFSEKVTFEPGWLEIKVEPVMGRDVAGGACDAEETLTSLELEA